MDHGLSQERSRRGAVTGNIVGLRGNFLDKLCPHVLEGVFQLDIAGNGHAIVGDGGSAELLVQHHIAALRPKGDLDCVSQRIDALAQGTTCIFIKQNLLCHLYYLQVKA